MRAAFCLLALAVSAPAAGVEVGASVPALSAARLGEPAQLLTLASFRGRVVYVDFWASWCVPCRLSMPALETLYRKHAPRGFAVVGFNKDTSLADARRFLARVPVSFMLAQDGDDAAARAFDVKAMPSGYLVDRSGVIRRVHRGFTADSAASLEAEIEALLAEPA